VLNVPLAIVDNGLSSESGGDVADNGESDRTRGACHFDVHVRRQPIMHLDEIDTGRRQALDGLTTLGRVVDGDMETRAAPCWPVDRGAGQPHPGPQWPLRRWGSLKLRHGIKGGAHVANAENSLANPAKQFVIKAATAERGMRMHVEEARNDELSCQIDLPRFRRNAYGPSNRDNSIAVDYHRLVRPRAAGNHVDDCRMGQRQRTFLGG
jgi:hypothetical protein